MQKLAQKNLPDRKTETAKFQKTVQEIYKQVQTLLAKNQVSQKELVKIKVRVLSGPRVNTKLSLLEFLQGTTCGSADPAKPGGQGSNASAPCCMLFPADYFNGKPGNRIYLPQTTIVGGQWAGKMRSTGAEARLDKTNTGKPPGTDASSSIILPGWDTTINQAGEAVIIARGHILGAQLGGSGTVAINLIPICQSINLRMRSVETEVKRHVDAGETVDYQVMVQYSDASAAIPKSISIWAISMTKSGQCWMLQQMPTVIAQPPSLNDCGG